MKRSPKDLLDAGTGLNKSNRIYTPNGELISLPDIIESMQSTPLANTTALIALGVDDRAGFQMVGRTPYYWDSTRTDNDSTNQLVARPTTIISTDPGRWVMACNTFLLQLAFTFATADGATLFTVPAGIAGLLVNPRCYYNITTSFTGGTASKIGFSSSNAAYATDGDLQGGASGDAAAALTAGIRVGTVGAAFASNGIVHLVPGDTILHQRMTSVFTAGEGKLLVPVTLL